PTQPGSVPSGAPCPLPAPDVGGPPSAALGGCGARLPPCRRVAGVWRPAPPPRAPAPVGVALPVAAGVVRSYGVGPRPAPELALERVLTGQSGLQVEEFGGRLRHDVNITKAFGTCAIGRRSSRSNCALPRALLNGDTNDDYQDEAAGDISRSTVPCRRPCPL